MIMFCLSRSNAFVSLISWLSFNLYRRVEFPAFSESVASVFWFGCPFLLWVCCRRSVIIRNLNGLFYACIHFGCVWL